MPAEMSPPMQAKLRVIGGKANKKEVLLKLPTVLGRSREAGLTIAHPMISRQHCELFSADGLVRIRDLGSTNGTYVAGKKVAESVLRPHDQFSVGPLTFEVEYEYVGDSTVAEEAAAAAMPGFAPASGPEAAEADEQAFQFLADEEPPSAEPPAAAAPEPAESPAESPAGGLDFLGATAKPDAGPVPEPEVSGPPGAKAFRFLESTAEGEFPPPAEEPAEFAAAESESGDFVPEPVAAEEPEPWTEPPEEVAAAPEPEVAQAEPFPETPKRGLEATELFRPPLRRAEKDAAEPLPAGEPPGDVPGIAPPDGQLPDFSAWDAAATADPSQTVDVPPDSAPAGGFDQGGEPAAEYPFPNAESEPGGAPAPTPPRKPKKRGWWPFGKGKPTAKGGTGRSKSSYPPSFEGFDDGAPAESAAPWQEESAPTMGSPTPPFPAPPPPSPPPVPPEENPAQAATEGDSDLDEFLKGLQ